jgi:hypothetical protein
MPSFAPLAMSQRSPATQYGPFAPQAPSKGTVFGGGKQNKPLCPD